jgi:hypothetical protein
MAAVPIAARVRSRRTVVTTPEYGPRLRARHEIERTLALDAASCGWDREVERHRCTGERIEKLLADLGRPINGLDDTSEDDH